MLRTFGPYGEHGIALDVADLAALVTHRRKQEFEVTVE
jgi:hypothetical protein